MNIESSSSVLNATEFRDIKRRIDNTDLVGLVVAQHMLRKLFYACRTRMVEGDKVKPDYQPELDLKASKPAKFKPARVAGDRVGKAKRA